MFCVWIRELGLEKKFQYGTAVSTEMQCCDEVTVESYGGILECHPYVLGDYRRIGQCGGRSFYQHKNNTDIFIYYVCGAWYVGLQVSCSATVPKYIDPLHWHFYNENW